MTHINKLPLVIVYVKDIAAAKDFYSETIGLGEPATDTDTWVEYDVGLGARLALHTTDGAADASNGPGSIKFVLQVSDIEAAVADLKANGAEITVEPRKESDFRWAEFKDCEGNVIRLNQ